MTAAATWGVAAAAWFGVGGVVAALLRRQGAELAAIAAAVPCWPVLLPALSERRREGPYTDRVRLAARSLAQAVAEAPEGLAFDLAGVERALLRADTRLARIDALLAEPDAAAADVQATLQAARHRAAAELEGVLAEMVRLRVRLGLLDASGPGLHTELRELVSRIAVLEEVA